MLTVYTLCWNEEVILPYFLRHYSEFADKIVIFDDGSTDKSLEIIKQCPKAEVRHKPMPGDAAKTKVKNTCWQGDKSDWVVVCDMDEFLWHPDLKSLLNSSGTIFKATGYHMISQSLPTTSGQIWTEIQEGFRIPKWDKCILFSPSKIKHTNFGPGCHTCKPVGAVRWGNGDQLKLLHYHYLSLDYVLGRYAERHKRQPDEEKKRGWCVHWSRTAEQITGIFNDCWAKREKVI